MIATVTATIEFWTALGAIGSIAYCVITTVTLIFLGVQLREARRDTLGQFVNQLGKEFEELEAIFEPLLSAGSGQFPANERALRCLQFFGRVKTLSDIGVLDVKIIDAMFGYQFYLFVMENSVWRSHARKPIWFCGTRRGTRKISGTTGKRGRRSDRGRQRRRFTAPPAGLYKP